jgi:hypothetical protein
VKKIWKFYASKSVITIFYKKGTLSRCAVKTAFCVQQSLLCTCVIVFKHLEICFCWCLIIVIYSVFKEQDSQCCRAVLYLCGLQYCFSAFSWLIPLVFSLTVSNCAERIEKLEIFYISPWQNNLLWCFMFSQRCLNGSEQAGVQHPPVPTHFAWSVHYLYITRDSITAECYRITDSPSVRVCKQTTGNIAKK